MVSQQGPSACSGKRLRFRQPGIKEMNIGVENHRGALPVWRRKKAYGSTGKSGMPPVGEKPGVSCRPKEKGGSATAWSPVLSDRRGKENGKKTERQCPTSLKAAWMPSGERNSVYKRESRAMGSAYKWKNGQAYKDGIKGYGRRNGLCGSHPPNPSLAQRKPQSQKPHSVMAISSLFPMPLIGSHINVPKKFTATQPFLTVAGPVSSSSA